MNTFKDILASQRFSTQVLNNNYCSEKSLNFIINSYHLQVLLNIIPVNIRNHIITLFPSKKNPNEMLILFKTIPVCNEFNKFHALKLLRIIQDNKTIAQKLNLTCLQKITGYVSKSKLDTHTIIPIYLQEIQEERSWGNFINHAKDKRLHESFERLRQIIVWRIKTIENLKNQHITSTPKPYNLADKLYNKHKKV